MARVMRDRATSKTKITLIILIQILKYCQQRIVIIRARPVWALGKLDKHLSDIVGAVVIKLPSGKEQKGLGKLIENFNNA